MWPYLCLDWKELTNERINAQACVGKDSKAINSAVYPTFSENRAGIGRVGCVIVDSPSLGRWIASFSRGRLPRFTIVAEASYSRHSNFF